MRGALNKIDGVAKIETDISSRTCSFLVPKDVDVEEKLNEVAEGNSHLSGFTITGGADESDAPPDPATSGEEE